MPKTCNGKLLNASTSVTVKQRPAKRKSGNVIALNNMLDNSEAQAVTREVKSRLTGNARGSAR